MFVEQVDRFLTAVTLGAACRWTWRAQLETALYFPYIEVPNTAWFMQILLYWDGAATIVPVNERGQTKLGRNMQALNDSGLLTFVSPLQWRRNDILGKVFLSFLERNGWVPPVEARTYTRLHRDKVNYDVVAELQDRGLAKKSASHDWWEVEESVANTYMAMLASAIAEDRRAAGQPTSPVTDRVDRLAYMLSPADSATDRVRQLRSSLIAELPVPSQPGTPGELATFKHDHAEQLQRLRDDLDSRIIQVATIQEASLREEAARILTREIGREVQAIKKAMESRGWPKIVLLGVTGVAGATIGTATAMLSAGTSVLLLGLAIGGGALAEGTSMYNLASLVKGARVDDSKPLAYAASVMALRRPSTA